MAFTVSCSDCGKQYQVDERKAGHRVKCRGCGNVFEIPHPQPVTASEGPSDPDPFEAAATYSAPPPPPLPPQEPEDPFAALAALEQTGVPLEEPPVRGGRSRSLPAPPPVAAAALPYVPPQQRVTVVATPAYGVVPQRPIGRAGRESGAVGTDSFTPLLIFGYLLAAVIMGIIANVKLMDRPPELRGGLIPVLWTTVGMTIVLLFAMIGPLTLLGVFVTSKIFNFRMVDSAYLRACGVAAVPGVVIALIQLLPPNPVLILLLVLGIVPLVFYVLKMAFDLDWAGAAVGFVFSGIFYLGGQWLSVMLLAALIVSGLFAQKQKNASIASSGPGSAFSSPFENSTDASSPSSFAPPTTPHDYEAERTAQFRARVVQVSAQNWDGMSREQVLGTIEGMKAEGEILRPAHGTEPAWQEAIASLTSMEDRARTRPSEKPDDSVFQPIASAAEWTPAPEHEGRLSDDVSFKHFRFRPPADALLDLRSSESDQAGLAWTLKKDSFARLTIATAPRRNTKQQRVWPLAHSFMKRAADAADFYAVDAEHANVSSGTIAGIPFTRIEADISDAAHAQRSVKYVGLVDDAWLILTISGRSEDAQACGLMESSVRSLRKTRSGEPRVDAFAPERVAACLADDGERAQELLLRAHGDAAEDAVAAQLKSSDSRVQKRAADILKQIGTERSLEALKAAAGSNDRQVVESVKAAIHRLSGSTDAVADALLDLESKDYFRRNEAFQTLASQAPDGRRDQVCAKLLPVVLQKGNANFNERDSAAKALAVWGNEKMVPQLLPLVTPDGENSQRHAAIIILGGLKDKRAVVPLLHCLGRDKAAVKDALIAIGPAAEDDVLKSLHDREPFVRRDAAEILGEIGTTKSLEPLARAAGDKKDFWVRDTALRAVEAVRDRIRESRKKPAQ